MARIAEAYHLARRARCVCLDAALALPAPPENTRGFVLLSAQPRDRRREGAALRRRAMGIGFPLLGIAGRPSLTDA